MVSSASLLGFICAVSAGSLLHNVPAHKHLEHVHRASSLPAGWSYVGCFHEPSNGRALSVKISDNNGNTPTTCTTACNAAGYSYAGTEYGEECWCGNALNQATHITDSNCNVPCSGDSSQKCGAGWTLSLYGKAAPSGPSPTKTTATASSTSRTAPTSSWLGIGCATDSSTRILNAKSKTDPQMTTEMCNSFCTGYTYSGVESGNECYCGNSLGNATIDRIFDCWQPCAGNPDEHCGDSWKINLFQAASSFTSVALPAPTGWNDLGCYADQSARTLASAHLIDPSMTPLKCQQFCQNYRFAGVENGNECYCGDQWTSYQEFLSTSGACQTPCAGDASKHCGSGWALEIYLNLSKIPRGYSQSYVGCFVDSRKRVLPVNPGPPRGGGDWSPSSCGSQCISIGYAYSGIEAGNECYCGGSLGSAEQVEDSQCNAVCAARVVEGTLCGGNWRLAVYKESAL